MTVAEGKYILSVFDNYEPPYSYLLYSEVVKEIQLQTKQDIRAKLADSLMMLCLNEEESQNKC